MAGTEAVQTCCLPVRQSSLEVETLTSEPWEQALVWSGVAKNAGGWEAMGTDQKDPFVKMRGFHA